MDFLTQTEQKLAAEISGNYQSLLEQQRDHEVRDTHIESARVPAVLVCAVLLINACVLAVVPGRDVHQATDSVLDH